MTNPKLFFWLNGFFIAAILTSSAFTSKLLYRECDYRAQGMEDDAYSAYLTFRANLGAQATYESIQAVETSSAWRTFQTNLQLISAERTRIEHLRMNISIGHSALLALLAILAILTVKKRMSLIPRVVFVAKPTTRSRRCGIEQAD